MNAVRAIFGSPLLFRKKDGSSLEKALPFVAEVYGTEHVGCDGARRDVELPAGERARKLGRFLHISYHSIPCDRLRTWRFLGAGALSVAWMALYPRAMKLRCLACATAYSFTEASFTTFERGITYTTLAQYAGNLLYIPLLLDAYGWLLESRPVAYVLLFPLNVWVLEVILGGLIRSVHGHNVAWNYQDYADEHFNGDIRLGGCVWWAPMGIIALFAYPPLRAVTEKLCR